MASNVLYNKSYNYDQKTSSASYTEKINVGTTKPIELSVTSLGVNVNSTFPHGGHGGHVVSSPGHITNTVTKTFYPDKDGNITFVNTFYTTAHQQRGDSFFKVETPKKADPKPTYTPTYTAPAPAPARAPAPTSTLVTKIPTCGTKTLIYDYTGFEGRGTKVNIKTLMPNGIVPVNTTIYTYCERARVEIKGNLSYRADDAGTYRSQYIVPEPGKPGYDVGRLEQGINFTKTISPDKNGDVIVSFTGLHIWRENSIYYGSTPTIVGKIYVNLPCDTPADSPPTVSPLVVDKTVNYTDVTVMVPSTNNIPVDVTQPYIVTNYIIKY
jgi:hypothetical protein